MKTLHISIIIILSITTIIVTNVAFAIPSGPPHFELGLQTDKVLYKPGDTVVIHVWGSGSAPENATVYLKIADATQDIHGTAILFQDTKNLVNNEIRFNYTIPQTFDSGSQPYRFIAEVFQNKNDPQPINDVYFVTKDNAQRLVISSVKATKLLAHPGDTIGFSAIVTDGLGNNIRGLTVRGDLPESNGRADYLFSDATYGNSTNSFTGSIQVPQSWSNYPQQNGTYTLRIKASPLYTGEAPYSGDYSIKGITPAENTDIKVQIITQTSNIPEFPFAIPVLIACIASLIIFYRMKFR
jgi:hypothetical protein